MIAAHHDDGNDCRSSHLWYLIVVITIDEFPTAYFCLAFLRSQYHVKMVKGVGSTLEPLAASFSESEELCALCDNSMMMHTNLKMKDMRQMHFSSSSSSSSLSSSQP